MNKKAIIAIVIVAGIIGVSLLAISGNNQSGSTGDFNIGAGANIGTLDNSTENKNSTTVKTDVNSNDNVLNKITNMTDEEKQNTILRKTLENNDSINELKKKYSDETDLSSKEIKKSNRD